MSNYISFQRVIEYVEALSPEDQELLIELIQRRQIERRRLEISRNAAQTLEALKPGKAKRGGVTDLQADLI
jgi:hypothetical protein